MTVLLTCDVHTHTAPLARVREDLQATRDRLSALGLVCTFYIPAASAEQLPDMVRALRDDGHEIGCHGLTHDPSENYATLPLARQRAILTEATERLAGVLGERPVTFRAPVFKISGATIRVLEELHYQADCSVNAQRLGLFGSDLYDLRPLTARRYPYRPSTGDPFRAGEAMVWEVPVSAALVPFVSNAERAFGLPFMRMLLRGLSVEGRLTGKPVVFMFHPEDVNGSRGNEPLGDFSWRYLFPTRTYGIQARYFLLERRWSRVARDLEALWEDMKRLSGVRFLTIQDYLPVLDVRANGHAASSRGDGHVVSTGSRTSPPVPASAPAVLTSKDVLCLSSIDWDFIWQGHQEIMATLAEHGNRVLFIENTGVRAPRLRDLSRLTHRLVNWMRSTKGFRKEQDNLFVYSPLLLPFPYSSMARWVNRWLLLRALQRWMRATGFRRPVLWTFLPTPLTLDLIRELEPELTVYYCIDDLASSSSAARRITKSETQLFRTADLVFVTSEKLRERAVRFNDQVQFFPFGVDFEKFEAVRLSTDDVPEDLRTVPRPVIGYVGGLHRWIDQGLLADVAGRMPEATFVLIGPAQTDLSRLLRCPNVRWLGVRPHDELPRYAKQFDVGIVPYHLSDYTAHVYPTKLNEYLAMGIPVIATDLPEIRRFNAEHGDVVAVVRDAGEFAQAIHAAMMGNSPELVRRRIEVSRRNSWKNRIAHMSVLIEQGLANRRAAGDRWQESLRRLYRTARRRLVRVVAVCGMVYLLIFQSPLLWWFAEPLRVVASPSAAEAIVVFAGGVGESGKAGGGYQERVKQAVDLYHAGQAPHIIVSSGYTLVFQEAEIMQELAVAHGVPLSAITLETRASNTHENVAFVADILDRHQWRSVLLVSSPYHMRRALLSWRKTAPKIQVVPAPVIDSRFFAHTRGASLEQIRGILHEYLGIVYYWWKGWI